MKIRPIGELRANASVARRKQRSNGIFLNGYVTIHVTAHLQNDGRAAMERAIRAVSPRLSHRDAMSCLHKYTRTSQAILL
jgi:hypothetical protein